MSVLVGVRYSKVKVSDSWSSHCIGGRARVVKHHGEEVVDDQNGEH